jgi:DNA-directed RNA polymerase II subunit RPB2
MATINEIPWDILNKYFTENPHFLSNHHLKSYNDFFNKGINQLFKERNPIHFLKERTMITTDDETRHIGYNTSLGESIPVTYTEMVNIYPQKSYENLQNIWNNAKGKGPIKTYTREDYKYECKLFVGGRNGDKLYFGKPIIYEKDGENHFMYPNEARLRNMTYSFTLHVDIEAVYKIYIKRKDGSNKYDLQEHSILLEKIYLGKFPIMLQSKQCILYNLKPEVRFNMGECRTDPGGYFIIDGKEKVIVTQEQFSDNIIYIQENTNDIYSHSAKIRSVSEDASKPIRTLAVRLVEEQPTSINQQIVVAIPNVRKPVPLFIVMRALGVISDKEIIEYCLLDIDKYENMVELFRSSVHDAGEIFTQQAALKYISSFTKGGGGGKNTYKALEVLTLYFLPHIGERNFKQKALFLGYMTKKLLKVSSKIDKPTNRDSYLYKRFLVSGKLIYDLFLEYYSLQQKNIRQTMDREHFKMKDTKKYKGLNFLNLIIDNQNKIFGNRIVENGFKKAFKGDWGSEAHTKRLGALQDLNRLSFFSTICQLRKTNVPLPGDSAKIVGPRLLNGTQWGLLCPIHTPDGGNVGLHKHMALMTHITSGCSGYSFIEYLRGKDLNMKLLEECTIKYLSQTTKILVNGAWVGCTLEPLEMVNTLRLRRRNGLFNIFISIGWHIEVNEIHIWTDAGRACHPLFPIYGDKISYQNDYVIEKILGKKYTWDQAVTGFGEKKIKILKDNCKIFKKSDLYPENTELDTIQSIVEYIDTTEMEGVKLAGYYDTPKDYIKKSVTHIEIHPSVILGVMANQIIFPSNNPSTRNGFSCGQSKQAVSLYNSNYQNRMDKSALVLHYGQNPLVRSRYLSYVTKNQHPYGVNAIVAVMCYTGFNVEDAVIINEGALKRGLFRTTYFTTYESHEEEKKIGPITIENKFMDVLNENVLGLKAGCDYSLLDRNSGLIRENVKVNDKTIIIGQASTSMTSVNYYIDESKKPKKGQLGYVDKSFLTENENGNKLAKIRIRHARTPTIGDKFCSRAGQKGTIGLILPESDMPFTKDGVRPDIIVNPHAMPSRMTIGHLVEALIAKASCLYGGLGDCTAFLQKGPKDKFFGDLLTKVGFHSTGNEIMYNGMTGEQLETEIYFGPTYYERLKHMVKDKINHRAKGPRSVLTRQTVGGRANDGGLRVGEMDRDSIIAHGMSGFLRESMMVRGDQFKMAICNKSGTIAVYNENKNMFISPIIDGPIKFVGNLENELNIVPITRFGRSFSIVNVPYAFKLLYQELQCMNVQMRLITADNVDQLTSLMGNNNNIIKLTGLDSLSKVKNEILRKTSFENNEITEFSSTTSNTQLSSQKETSQPVLSQPLSSYLGKKVVFQGSSDKWIVEQIDKDGLMIVKGKDGSIEMKEIKDVSFWFGDNDNNTPVSPDWGHVSPDWGPVSPDWGPVSPDWGPDSPDWNPPKELRELNITGKIIGDLVLWKGDPQPGRMWKISNVDEERHEVDLIPGSFEGNDNIKVSFADILDLPTKNVGYTKEIDIDDKELEEEEIPIETKEKITIETKEDNTGSDDDSWEISENMKERIKEKGLEENFKKQQEEQKEKGENTAPEQIVIRTPVLEKDDTKSLPNLATIEGEGEGEDGSDQEKTGVKKLITKIL